MIRTFKERPPTRAAAAGGSLKKQAQASVATWYAATLVFISDVGDVASIRPLCEERIVLFLSKNAARASAAAEAYGDNEVHSYRNTYGQLVRWRFAGIEKVERLQELPDSDGWEVASRFVRRSWRTLKKLQTRARPGA